MIKQYKGQIKNKQYKGQIKNWRRIHFDLQEAEKCFPGENLGLGWYIVGTFLDHPSIRGINAVGGNTSFVLKEKVTVDGILIETRNSKYLLVGEPYDGKS